MTEEGFRAFVSKQKFKFAKTMPKHPHSYIVKFDVDLREFNEAVLFIRAHGRKEMFFKRELTYYYVDGYKYWTMGYDLSVTKILNRAKL